MSHAAIMVQKDYRIALLLCDTPLGPVKARFGDYRTIFGQWLRTSHLSCPPHVLPREVSLVIDSFDVVDRGEYPDLTRLRRGAENAYDAIVLTGSRYTVHEQDPPFIPQLIDFVKEVGTKEAYQHVKIIGICFGHQIISWAMGGTSERGEKGWEVGVYGATVTSDGQQWFTSPAETCQADRKIYIEQMHRDHVPSPPPGFEVILKTDKYPIQGMVKHHVTSTPQRPVAQIYSVQGHPEFTPELVELMVEYRISHAIFDEETGKEASRRVWGKNKEGGEGLGKVGWSIWKALLTEATESV